MAIRSMSLFLKDISYLAYISQYDLYISEMTVRKTLTSQHGVRALEEEQVGFVLHLMATITL
jgi:hypothetical protein